MNLKVITDDPDPQVVEKLEGLLKRAKSGDLSSFVLLGDSKEMGVLDSIGGNVSVVRVIGQLEAVKFLLLRGWASDGEESE